MTRKLAENVSPVGSNRTSAKKDLFTKIVSAMGLALCCSMALAQSAPIPTVVATQAMGPITQNPVIVGRDGAWSAVIDNKSMWTFSDTKISANNAKGDTLISNSRSWTTNFDASNGIDLTGDYTDSSGMVTESFPFTQDEIDFNDAHGKIKTGCTISTDPLCGQQYAIWSAPIMDCRPADMEQGPKGMMPPPAQGHGGPPCHPAQAHGGPGHPHGSIGANTNEGYYFYKLLMRGGSIPGRIIVGVGIAYEQNGVLQRPILSPGTAHPTLMWQLGPQGQSFTAYYAGGILLHNTLYMMSCDTIVRSNHECLLGRVPIANILTLSDWSYYNATSGWQSDPTQASVLFDGSPNGSSIIYIAPLKEYMTMYSPKNSNQVVYRVALQPWGPWSAEQNLFLGQAPINVTQGGDYDYDTQPHTEFQEQNGLVQYVTYIQRDGDLGQGGEQIQLVRVTFAPGQ